MRWTWSLKTCHFRKGHDVSGCVRSILYYEETHILHPPTPQLHWAHRETEAWEGKDIT